MRLLLILLAFLCVSVQPTIAFNLKGLTGKKVKLKAADLVPELKNANMGGAKFKGVEFRQIGVHDYDVFFLSAARVNGLLELNKALTGQAVATLKKYAQAKRTNKALKAQIREIVGDTRPKDWTLEQNVKVMELAKQQNQLSQKEQQYFSSVYPTLFKAVGALALSLKEVPTLIGKGSSLANVSQVGFKALGAGAGIKSSIGHLTNASKNGVGVVKDTKFIVASFRTLVGGGGDDLQWPTDEPDATDDLVVEVAPPPTAPVVEFDGQSGYISVPNLSQQGLTEMTVEVWVKWNKVQKWSRVFDFGKEGNALLIQSEKTSDKLNFVIYDENNKRHRIQIDNAVKEGVWTHIAAVSGPSGMRFYINGELKGDDTYSGSLNVVGDNGFFFGKSNWESDKLFNGQMAEFRIWNRERWPNEIVDNMKKPLTGQEDGLIGYWPLTNMENGVVKSTAGNELDLVFQGRVEVIQVMDLPVEVKMAETPKWVDSEDQGKNAETVAQPD